MRAYYFRAYDSHGHKRVGKIQASSPHLVRAELLRNGLRPYLIKDLAALKSFLELRRGRRRRLLFLLAGTAVFAFALGAGLVAYAGRDRAPGVAEYAKSGIVAGASGIVTAEDDACREFGLGIYDIWNSYCPNLATGLEVKKPLMVVYVSGAVRGISKPDLEALATNSAKALQRKFGATGCTVLVADATSTLLEVNYNGYTHVANAKSYW